MDGDQDGGEIVGRGGLRLFTAVWRPVGSTKAIVVLVHGYGEHLGRYTRVVAAQVERGYVVVGLDHRGHGRSGGRRAAIGRGDRFDDFVEDLGLLVERTRAAFSGVPVFLLGHSMGGLIATRYALEHGDGLAGMVLSGAAIRIGDDVSPLLRRLGGLVAALAPHLPVVPPRPGVLSSDPEVERRFNTDPFCYAGGLRAGFGHAFQRAAQETQAHLDRLTLPLLVMHGAEDRLTNPAGSELLHDRARSADKTFKRWPGLRHEIFNEPGGDAVIACAANWLDLRSDGSCRRP